jgi:hypothetical protein
MKTIIFADDMLIWGKDEKENKEKLYELYFIIKEHGVKININSDYENFEKPRHEYQNTC